MRARERRSERDHERRVLRRRGRRRRSRSCATAPASPDVVVVDPPRAGLSGRRCGGSARLEAPRIVYVSCNPTTLAGERQGARAASWGYRLERARPVDMFPHTPHVETVVATDASVYGVAACRLDVVGCRRDRCPVGELAVSAVRAAHGATAGRRSRAGSASESSGSAGRPAGRSRRRARASRRTRRHQRATSSHAQAEARGARRGRARRRGGRAGPRCAAFGSPGHREGERERVEDAGWCCDDVLRRPAPDRVGVDERDDRGDEHDPGRASRRSRGTRTPSSVDGAELREVRGDVEPERPASADGERDERERRRGAGRARVRRAAARGRRARRRPG